MDAPAQSTLANLAPHALHHEGTGLRALGLMFDKFEHRGTRVLPSGVQAQPMKVLFESGFIDRLGLANVCANVDAALMRARELLA